MNTDATWNYFGSHNPYYGVLTSDHFRDGANAHQFWRSGQLHVERLLGLLQRLFDLPKPVHFRRVLDFGCGVGRLAVPLSAACDCLVGVDISDAMLAEARRNARQMDLHNTSFVASDDELSAISGTYDLVHSYIVLQHIRASRGCRIIDALVRCLKPNGIGALQLTYERETLPHVELAYQLCTRIRILTKLLNCIVLKRPSGQPLAEMNEYRLADIVKMLFAHGCGRLYLEPSDTGARWYNTKGVYLFFQKSPVPNW